MKHLDLDFISIIVICLNNDYVQLEMKDVLCILYSI